MLGWDGNSRIMGAKREQSKFSIVMVFGCTIEWGQLVVNLVTTLISWNNLSCSNAFLFLFQLAWPLIANFSCPVGSTNCQRSDNMGWRYLLFISSIHYSSASKALTLQFQER